MAVTELWEKAKSGVGKRIKQTQMDSLLTAKEVKGILRVSLPAVYKMAERGQLPCVRWDCPGKGEDKPRTTVRFKQSDIMEFVQKHYMTP